MDLFHRPSQFISTVINIVNYYTQNSQATIFSSALYNGPLFIDCEAAKSLTL